MRKRKPILETMHRPRYLRTKTPKVIRGSDLRRCIDLIRRFTGLNHAQLCFRMGFSEAYIAKLIGHEHLLSLSLADNIRHRLIHVVETEFDPLYPPVPKLGKTAWRRVCESVRRMIGIELRNTIPTPRPLIEKDKEWPEGPRQKSSACARKRPTKGSSGTSPRRTGR